MNDNDIIKVVDVLDKFEFFGGQRAGRELWFDKPADIQDEDIKQFVDDVHFLKNFINLQKAEIERLKAENGELKLKMSYMKEPNTIGDIHEMGAW
jgi:hypothetical protein